MKPKAGKSRKGVVRAPSYTLEIAGRLVRVTGPEEASRVVSEIRDRSGAGASEMGAQFTIREDGHVVGYVSYNGKVWKGDPDRDDAELIYTPPPYFPTEDIPSRPARQEAHPRGTAAEVARTFAERLLKNTDEYMAGLASHADFSARQHEIWGQVEAAGTTVHEEVLRLLRTASRSIQGG